MGKKTINNRQEALQTVFMLKLITMVLCISIAMNTGMSCHATSSEAAVLSENSNITKSDVVAVASHKQFVKKIYRIAVKRKSSGIFYCNGNGGKIFDVTWDDPTGGGDVLQYDYFLMGKNQFEQSHAASAEFRNKIKKVGKKNHKKWKSLQ